MRATAFLLASAILFFALGTAARADPPPMDLATYPRAALEIVQRTPQPERRFDFEVWVADTPARSEQGLMYVRDLPADHGMVFLFEPARVVSFWMKNTYIELDMLFIDAGGQVVKIIAHAPPLRLDLLSSDVPVGAVLELRGGEAGLLGIKVGDHVSWKRTAKP
ncbi:MAG TPA: DUF192 domain-containing protein [Steroidobacteraceae bacterium]|nr:DUF192 domain-containing protein [Steroidobacteraceae bacterium]